MAYKGSRCFILQIVSFQQGQLICNFPPRELLTKHSYYYSPRLQRNSLKFYYFVYQWSPTSSANRLPHYRTSPEVNASFQVSVGVNAFGTMELEKGCEYTWCEDIHWVRVLRLSEDCYGYNVLLRLMPSSKLNRAESTSELSLVLQCTRPIEPGQELSLWFSHEVLAMMQLTFLNPANIQGE